MASLPDAYQPCPVARAADVIGDRWSLLIVRDVFDGQHRFGDLQRGLGMARNILADRLRRLVEAGVLDTRPASDGSAYLEYVLTERGEQLFPVIVALRQWGERQLFDEGEPHSLLVDTQRGQPLPYMAPKDSLGHVLEPAQAIVRKLP